MQKWTNALIRSLVVVVASCTEAVWSAPIQVPYSGQLAENGELVNGNRAMRFRIFVGTTNQLRYDSGPVAAVPVSNGAFSVMIGAAGQNALDSSVFGTLGLTLEITVGANVLAPRVDLPSAPYAANADRIGGLASTELLLRDGSQAMTGNLDLGGRNLTNGGSITAASGDFTGRLTMDSATVAGDLSVQGNLSFGDKPSDITTFHSVLNAEAGLTVNGGDLTIGERPTKLDVDFETGDTTVAGSLDLAGEARLGAGLAVTGPATVGGTLDVTGATSLSSLLTVSAGGASISDGLTVASGTVTLPASSIESAEITDGTIVNADVNGSAAIAYGKLNLASSVTSNDILNGSLVSADLSTTAGITNGQLANSAVTVTAGNGLGGGGSVALGGSTSLTVNYGATANTAVQGNQTATIGAGTGLTGGGSGDALGDGFNLTLNVGGGNGITASADSLALGPLTANWSQTGAFDVVLNNAASELSVMDSDGSHLATFDVGNLAATTIYTFAGAAGTVWTSGNDGPGSTLDADTLDGQQASAFAGSAHTHAVLTAGTGLGGGTYNGGTAATFNVAYGATAGTAVQGNQTATIGAGTGLTGGGSGDALGDGFNLTLNVGGGNGITASADSLALGPLTANWSQAGAFDVVLNNAASELSVMDSDGSHLATFDVGNLAATTIYTFAGAAGTVWTSGNDGPGSTLDADTLDGISSAGFATTVHSHATLTAGTGLSGGPYNGSAAATFDVAYGTTAGTAVEGNQTATIGAGTGLTGGGSGDALGDGFNLTLNVGGGNGITASANAVDLGPLTANWTQSGAFDLVLNNAASELSVMDSDGSHLATFDVGNLTAATTYTFAGAAGTVWTSGNDGTGSGLNADTLDGISSAGFATAAHTHATLTAGTGLSGGPYNGGAAATIDVAYGTTAGTAVEGNQTATVTAGNGLTGGASGDALGDGFSLNLAVGAGNAITVAADTVGVANDGINGAQLADNITLDADLTITGATNTVQFSTLYVQLPRRNTEPADTDCDNTAELGRVTFYDRASGADAVCLCADDGGGLEWVDMLGGGTVACDA